MAWSKGRKLRCLLLLIVSFALYANTYDHEFVFDDVSAIRDNLDLRPDTPLYQLFENDFWGTPMQNERSHKSYRPLTVLTFRANYAFSELNAGPYHLANAAFHAIVCALLPFAIEYVFECDESVSQSAAWLFAVHAVHTEAVAGVVGRAELLSAIFYLLALLLYVRCARNAQSTWHIKSLLRLTGVALLVAMGTLCKEQCATALGLCIVHDLLYAQPLDIAALLRQSNWKESSNGAANGGQGKPVVSRRWVHRGRLRAAASRWLVLLCCGAVLLVCRIKVVQAAQLPKFTPFDNPAASSLTPTRQLTFNYLLVENFWLLLCPSWLVCDWTMGTIPLVHLTDPRNLLTLAFWFALLATAFTLFRKATPVWRSPMYNKVSNVDGKAEAEGEAGRARQALMACACVAVPFLPATNLFFPVGFVVAERVLYTPSIGFCVLVAIGYQSALQASGARRRALLKVFFSVLLITQAAKTVLRNQDWHDEHSLFSSGVKLNRRNAKLWNNVGHALEAKNQLRQALDYFEQARQVQPDDRGAWQNVARTLASLNETERAEQAYRHAIALLPQPRSGVNYTARVAPGDLQSFTSLARLLVANGNRFDEAEALLTRVLSMRADFAPAHATRGELRMKAGQIDEAASAFREALRLDARNADVLYNLGVVEYARRDVQLALRYLDDALRIKPSHKLALYNSALIVQESKLWGRYTDAKRRLTRLIAEEPDNADAHFQLAMLAGDENRNEDAEKHYRAVLQIDPLYRGALFNLALLYGQHLKRPVDAAPLLATLLSAYPDHVSGNLLMGQLNVNDFKNLDAAEKNFQAVLQIEPSNSIAMHHLCIVIVERGNLEDGERCLENVKKLAPGLSDIDVHLQIVRSRLANLQRRRTVATATATATASATATGVKSGTPHAAVCSAQLSSTCLVPSFRCPVSMLVLSF